MSKQSFNSSSPKMLMNNEKKRRKMQLPLIILTNLYGRPILQMIEGYKEVIFQIERPKMRLFLNYRSNGKPYAPNKSPSVTYKIVGVIIYAFNFLININTTL